MTVILDTASKVLTKNVGLSSVKAGTPIVSVTVQGYNDVGALQASYDAFRDAFGRDPDPVKTVVVIQHTSFDTNAELQERVDF